MRVMISQNHSHEGRDNVEDSEEEEDEEVQGEWMEEEVAEIESGDGGDNVLATNPIFTAIRGQANSSVDLLDCNHDKEGGGDNSNVVVELRNMKDSKLVDGGILLGQEEGVDGPQKSTNTDLSITGGVRRNLTQSEDVGRLHLPLNS
ncbi:hypothetical protein A2U01_0052364, partial [Trifolium medium]|nr:hypothetical protein [Trifolium medium]